MFFCEGEGKIDINVGMGWESNEQFSMNNFQLKINHVQLRIFKFRNHQIL